MNIYSDITQTVGRTPLVRINRIVEGAEVLAKLECFNPLGSVKDRPAKAMIEEAERAGKITKETHIIEATSGNTGIGLAFVCAVKGYRLTIVMPDTMSVERRKILQTLGAHLVLTEGAKGMQGAIAKADELAQAEGNAFIPGQFINPNNPLAHERTTAIEIWNDTEGSIDIFIAGVGTGGTLTGVGRALKARNANIRIIAVEPTGSAVLSGYKKGPHKIQGIGAGFIPYIVDESLIDKIVPIRDEEAFAMKERLGKEEGMFVGISSGAAMAGAAKIAAQSSSKGKRIVTIFPDTGERYLS